MKPFWCAKERRKRPPRSRVFGECLLQVLAGGMNLSLWVLLRFVRSIYVLIHWDEAFSMRQRTPKVTAAFSSIWRINAAETQKRYEPIFVSIALFCEMTICTNTPIWSLFHTSKKGLSHPQPPASLETSVGRLSHPTHGTPTATCHWYWVTETYHPPTRMIPSYNDTTYLPRSLAEHQPVFLITKYLHQMVNPLSHLSVYFVCT